MREINVVFEVTADSLDDPITTTPIDCEFVGRYQCMMLNFKNDDRCDCDISRLPTSMKSSITIGDTIINFNFEPWSKPEKIIKYGEYLINRIRWNSEYIESLSICVDRIYALIEDVYETHKFDRLLVS